MSATRMNRGWGGVLLAGLLLALPALAQGDRCEADCATKASEPMQTCVNSCPKPGKSNDLKATTAYRSCATRCSKRFQESFKTCKSKCAPKKDLKK